MKTKITLLCLFFVINFGLRAQTYVTIPDTNFVTFLQQHYPSCMNGNQMDINCPDIQSVTNLAIGGIFSLSDITGIEYFSNLQDLDCSGFQLTNLPTLPNSLQYLRCSSNNLTNLGTLPNSLKTLDCSYNLLTSLPLLPNSIQTLDCGFNELSSITSLPNSLSILRCGFNQLTELQNLPNSLQLLICYYNQLAELPILPNSILEIHCNDNQLTNFPILPLNIQILNCSNNHLQTLPNFPGSLRELFCRNNNIFCFSNFPNTITNQNFDVSGNPFTCLPNYINAMNATTLAYPLCVVGDLVNNSFNCLGSQGIFGTVYKDNNNNCVLDGSDIGIKNIPLNIYDNSNNLLTQISSFEDGIYNFADSAGIYKVVVDTAEVPYTIQCVSPGIDTTVILTMTNSLASNVNFPINCKPGFDVGVQSVYRSGWVFPGRQHRLSILAGDMSNWYNLHCASGINGQVQITVMGPVTFDSIVSGSMTPSIAGNVFTYNIPDFGSVNMQQDFNLLFSVDTSAQIGDTICVNVNVTPATGDNNQSNNNFQYCYTVTNSHDPNMKEVYPINVQPGYQDWLTYTVHFQNTGSAPAMNIRVTDTLDNNLDLETFQVINYSHYNTVSLQSKNLTFRFPHIMLPDSTSDSEGSKGFVQYRIKPKSNLQLGTQIENTANIYFDYNPAVITNTTINEFVSAVSVNEITASQTLSIYPNPSNGKYFIKLSEGINISELNIEVYNLLGEIILSTKSQNNLTELDLSHQPNGIYFIKATSSKHSFNQRLIKQ